jgi:hypothetical protein
MVIYAHADKDGWASENRAVCLVANSLRNVSSDLTQGASHSEGKYQRRANSGTVRFQLPAANTVSIPTSQPQGFSPVCPRLHNHT